MLLMKSSKTILHVRRWLQALQYDLNRRKTLQQETFYGSRFYNEVQLRSDMQQCIDTVNAHSPKDRPWLKSLTYPNMNHEHLMKIHEEFENLQADPNFRSPQSPMEMKKALIRLNILIHRYEGFHGDKNTFHVDVAFFNRTRWCFEEGDYRLFDPNLKSGDLYLDYGVVGVPVLNSYHKDVKQRPVPQYNFTSGSKINFRDTVNYDQFKDALKSWLHKKWQMDIEDSHLAIGYIPLGRLIGGFNVEEIGEKLERHTFIKSIDIFDATTLFPVSIPFQSSRIKKYPLFTKVFVFNNKKLFDPLFRSIPHFKPKTLYSVASGFKPYFLLKEISQRTQQTPDLHFFDYAQNALDYQKGMKNIHKKNKFISYLADNISGNMPFAINDDCKTYLDLKFVAEDFQRCLDEYFQKNFDSLHETIQRTTSYTRLNIFTDTEVLIDKIGIDKEFMIWTSNIWNSRTALHSMSREELDDNFINFVHTIGKKINKSSWMSIDNGLHCGLWGNSKDKPYGMITCGHSTVNYSDFKPILGVKFF